MKTWPLVSTWGLQWKSREKPKKKFKRKRQGREGNGKATRSTYEAPKVEWRTQGCDGWEITELGSVAWPPLSRSSNLHSGTLTDSYQLPSRNFFVARSHYNIWPMHCIPTLSLLCWWVLSLFGLLWRNASLLSLLGHRWISSCFCLATIKLIRLNHSYFKGEIAIWQCEVTYCPRILFGICLGKIYRCGFCSPAETSTICGNRIVTKFFWKKEGSTAQCQFWCPA